MKMYEVCAKCGHVGRNNYTDKVFAIKANSGKEAAAIARQLPRVKHHHKDAIRYVEEITLSRYIEIIRYNNADPYMQCKSIQEQRAKCNLMSIKRESDAFTKHKEAITKKETKYYKKMELRHPKKYMNNYIAYEETLC